MLDLSLAFLPLLPVLLFLGGVVLRCGVSSNSTGVSSGVCVSSSTSIGSSLKLLNRLRVSSRLLAVAATPSFSWGTLLFFFLLFCVSHASTCGAASTRTSTRRLSSLASTWSSLAPSWCSAASPCCPLRFSSVWLGRDPSPAAGSSSGSSSVEASSSPLQLPHSSSVVESPSATAGVLDDNFFKLVNTPLDPFLVTSTSPHIEMYISPSGAFRATRI